MSFSSLRANLAMFGRSGTSATLCAVSEGTFVLSRRTVALLSASTKCTRASVSFDVFLAKSGRWPSNVGLPAPLVGNLESASAAWCFTPKQ